MLSRVIFGSRASLPVALILVSLAAAIGSVIGAIAGYFRGVADGVLMRSTDLVFAFPPIILAMVVAAVLGPRAGERGARDRRRRLAVVRARRARPRPLGGRLGVRPVGTAARRVSRKTLVRDMFPNVAGPVFVLATLDLGNAILLLAGLSFLGLGAQPPKAEWGSMVAEGTQYFQWWWIGTFPGLAIFSVVLAFNLIGDSLRDVFDPRTARRPVESGE